MYPAYPTALQLSQDIILKHYSYPKILSYSITAIPRYYLRNLTSIRKDFPSLYFTLQYLLRNHSHNNIMHRKLNAELMNTSYLGLKDL